MGFKENGVGIAEYRKISASCPYRELRAFKQHAGMPHSSRVNSTGGFGIVALPDQLLLSEGSPSPSTKPNGQPDVAGPHRHILSSEQEVSCGSRSTRAEREWVRGMTWAARDRSSVRFWLQPSTTCGALAALGPGAGCGAPGQSSARVSPMVDQVG